MRLRQDIVRNREVIIMNNAKKTMLTEAESEIYFCAFRYCLGRMSDVVSDYYEEATRKIRQITDHFLLLLEKELSEAILKDDEERAKGEPYKTLGWDCDRSYWVKLFGLVSEEVDRRELEHWAIKRENDAPRCNQRKRRKI